MLVEVGACGVCASELEPWTGRAPARFPLRPGHEVSGTVVGVGAASPDSDLRFAVGDRIAVWTLGSGFAEYVAAPSRVLPTDSGPVPADLGLLEPIACAANAVELADVRLGDDVVIIGAGFMGALVQQLVAAPRRPAGHRGRPPARTCSTWPAGSAPPVRWTAARSRPPR